jgi:enoyl-CoA hydratase
MRRAFYPAVRGATSLPHAAELRRLAHAQAVADTQRRGVERLLACLYRTSLFHSDKPVVCKVHGFCVAGGTDMALCSDLLVIADDARIGYPPARVWGVPTSALWAFRVGDQRAKRLLFTGDLIDGRTALDWGLAIEAPPAAELDERFEQLVARIALTPINQLVMMKQLVNQALYAQGLHATQALGVFFDGVARHTEEGYAFQRRAAEAGWRRAVEERDEPYG